MELGQLVAFERAVREGSFTRAAEALGLTQPSVSARIAALEAEVGGPLFERGGRVLRLTPLGEAFWPYAERALAVLADGLDAARRCCDGQLGHVTIAAMNPLALFMLDEVLDRFRAEYPAVDVTVRERHPRQVRELLHDGDVRLGMLGPPVWDKALKALALFREPVEVVASADHPLAQRVRQEGAIQLANLFDYTIYRVTLGPRVSALVGSFVEQGRRGSGGAVVQVPAVLALRPLRRGQGIAFLPRSYVQRHVQAGSLTYLPIADLEPLTNEVVLVTMAGRALDQPNAAFVQMIRATCRHMLVD